VNVKRILKVSNMAVEHPVRSRTARYARPARRPRYFLLWKSKIIAVRVRGYVFRAPRVTWTGLAFLIIRVMSCCIITTITATII